MIPKKYSGDELRNKFCRPVRKIRNGGGAAISPETIFTEDKTMLVLGEYKALQKCFHI